LPVVRKLTAASTPAYVLHTHDWSESSLILDLFTLNHGRVVAVAKGAKRPHSQLRPVLLPFQCIDVTFGSKSVAEDQVWLLRHAEWGGGPAWPGGAALLPGLYVNEILMRLLPRHDNMPRLWSAYAALLPVLTAPDTLHAGLRAFELLVLRQMGHLPDLALHSTSSEPVSDEVFYTLHPELGVCEAQQDEAALPGWIMRQLEQALGQAMAAKVRTEGLPTHLMQACQLASSPLRNMVRSVLIYHVGPAPLRTRQLMLDLSQSTP
jgi:DNA repair protein RecO (recombination protein O)